MGDVAILADAEWPEEIRPMLASFAGRLNVYRVMAHHPALLTAWATLRDHLVLRSALTPQQSELVILRTGWRWGSRYEWRHHLARGRQAGLDAEAIARCAATSPTRADGDGMLVEAVDELMTQGRLGPLMLDRVTALVGTKGLLDVMATIGMYTTLALLLRTFDVPLDADVAALIANDPLSDIPTAELRGCTERAG